jgi:integrase/recombinase XerD
MNVKDAYGHLELFYEYILSEKGLSSHTFEAYKRDLDTFCHSFAHQTLKDAVSQYGLWLMEKHFATATMRRKIYALRQFLLFLLDEGHIKENLAHELYAPKAQRTLPIVLKENQVEQLIMCASKDASKEGVRFYAMLELLYGTGMRVSELVSLPLSALRYESHQFILKGKGGKERLVIIGSSARKAMDAYLCVRETFLFTKKEQRNSKGLISSKNKENFNPYLFPSKSQQGHITRQRFAQLLKICCLNAGLDPTHLSPHGLRHAFATHLLQRGAHLVSIKNLLGHSDIATTEIYTHLLDDALTHLVETCHPLNRVLKA